MKRLILSSMVIALIAGGMQSFAVVDTNQMFSDDYMRNQGYSPEFIRMMNLRRVDPYAPYEKKETKNTPAKWVKKLYQYVDPATDNQKFGEGVIDPKMDMPSKLF